MILTIIIKTDNDIDSHFQFLLIVIVRIILKIPNDIDNHYQKPF
tara:strand:+ start:4402 stop:4533 length:132 start_codon:yes stop_codon:yes gene_type:complete